MSAPKKIEPSKLAPFFESIVNADANNRFCADCHSKNPRWASTNLGIFLCIKCAGIHRHIGTHITKVKSTTLDCWEERQIMTMKRVGNSLAATVWEATLPSSYPRPNEQSEGMSLESFIRNKYEHRKWFNKAAYEAVYNGKGAVPKPKPAAAPAPAPKPAPKPAPQATTNFFDMDAPASRPAAAQPSTNFFDFGTPAAQPKPQQPQQKQQSSVNLLSFDEPAKTQAGARVGGTNNADIMALFGSQPQYQQVQHQQMQMQQPQQYQQMSSPFMMQPQPQPQQQQPQVNLYAPNAGGANYSVDLSAYGIYRGGQPQPQQQQQQQQYYMQQQQQMYGYNPAYNRNGF